MVIVIQILSFNMENGRWSILMFCIYWNEYNVFKEWVSTVVSFRISFLFISESYSSTIWIMKRTISSISISHWNHCIHSYCLTMFHTLHKCQQFAIGSPFLLHIKSINTLLLHTHSSSLSSYHSSLRESVDSWVCWYE